MKRQRSFLVSASLAVAMLLNLTGCVSSSGGSLWDIQKPSVSLISLTPKKVSRGELAFDVGLLVKNPNALPLPIKTVSSELALNGIYFLSTSGTSKKAIPANASGKMTLSTTVGLDKVKSLAKTLRGRDIQYDLSGDVGVGVLGQTVDFPFHQGGKVNAAQLAKKLIKISLRN